MLLKYMPKKYTKVTELLTRNERNRKFLDNNNRQKLSNKDVVNDQIDNLSENIIISNIEPSSKDTIDVNNNIKSPGKDTVDITESSNKNIINTPHEVDRISLNLRLFINNLKDGKLKKNRYYCFMKNITWITYRDIIRPYFITIVNNEKLLFKMYYKYHDYDQRDIYIKNADTKSYRKRLTSYFINLTQDKTKGVIPQTYFNEDRAQQLARNIMILYGEYGFTIVPIKYKCHFDGSFYYKYKLISD
jgi:hypothetical protein